jgi:hypothetical protein
MKLMKIRLSVLELLNRDGHGEAKIHIFATYRSEHIEEMVAMT